jgi:hypothetical protein
MAIATCTIAMWSGRDADGDPLALPLIEALQYFGKSRATKNLIRQGKKRAVYCELRVPFLLDCRVRSNDLGRALRKVLHTAIDGSDPGAQFTIDFHVRPESWLVVQAERKS